MLDQNKKYQSFTLVEVLIAVAIIGSIAGIAIAQFKIALDRSRQNKAISEVEAMGAAIEQIEEEMRRNNNERIYIRQLEWLAEKKSPDPEFSPWQGPYISSPPPRDENGHFKDPWGNRYYYNYWTSESELYYSEAEVPDEYKWQLPPKDTLEEEGKYAWYNVYGGSDKGGFVLGSYGSDGEPGGEGYAQDIIYRQYYPPIIQVEKEEGRCGRCFIATAAYGSYEEPHVQVLRKFRDKYLLTNEPGRKLVKLYYRYSPCAASFISKHNVLRAIVRTGLLPIIGLAYLLINTTLLQKFLLLTIIVLSPTLLLLRRKRLKT